MLADVIEETLAYSYFGDDAPLPFRFDPGSDEARLLVVTGDNATGKSFFRQVFSAYCRKNKVAEVMDIGMHRRTEAGMERAFIYGGSDRDNSTGCISLGPVTTAIRTAQGREQDHYVILDEPDLGLSEGYARAMGEYLGQYLVKPNAKTLGFVVMTHSRALAGELFQYLGQYEQVPHSLRMDRLGGQALSMQEWLGSADPKRSVEDLLALPKQNRDLHLRLSALQNERRQSGGE